MSEVVVCYSCGARTIGLLRTDGEYSCRSCLSTFVELVNPPDYGPDVRNNPNSLTGDLSAIRANAHNFPVLAARFGLTAGAGAAAGAAAGAGAGAAAGAVNNVALAAALESILRAPNAGSAGNPLPAEVVSGFIGQDLNRATIVQLLHQILLNGMGGAAPVNTGTPAAPASVIAALPRVVVDEENRPTLGCEGECYISQEAFELGEMSVSLPCRHAFKEEAIVRWLALHNTCPVCRVAVTRRRINAAAAGTPLDEDNGDDDDDDDIPSLIENSSHGSDEQENAEDSDLDDVPDLIESPIPPSDYEYYSDDYEGPSEYDEDEPDPFADMPGLVSGSDDELDGEGELVLAQ